MKFELLSYGIVIKVPRNGTIRVCGITTSLSHIRTNLKRRLFVPGPFHGNNKTRLLVNRSEDVWLGRELKSGLDAVIIADRVASYIDGATVASHDALFLDIHSNARLSFTSQIGPNGVRNKFHFGGLYSEEYVIPTRKVRRMKDELKLVSASINPALAPLDVWILQVLDEISKE